MASFRDRVALVTGSTGEGLGRSIALTLAREGARVVLNYGTGHPHNAHAADKVLAEIRHLGGKGYAIKADTREEGDIQGMIEGVIKLYGRLDFLVCNAGGEWDSKDVTDITQDHWRSVMKAEVDGVFYCIKHALPHMREAHFGRIVAVGFAGVQEPGEAPLDYVLGKTTRHALLQRIARQELSQGITCNVVAPGHTPRPTMRQAIEAAKHAPAWKRRTSSTPQDGAEVVRFLCSDEATFVTGNIVIIAGTVV